ncbi:MAG: phospho-N-acetylmuramoyl-pentapeptide-transferase [Pseudoflavonifractor sp.]
MRFVTAFLVAFAVAFLTGKLLVPALRRRNAGQGIKEYGPAWHNMKQGTPTMGGLMFIVGLAVALVAVGWRDLIAGRFGGLFVLCFALVFGAIGFVDDYKKVKGKHGDGLSAGAKFLLQLAAAILFTVLMRNLGYIHFHLYIPFLNITLFMPDWLYMIFAAFAMVATVNAVNLTDGIDGLATGVTMPVALFFLAVSVLWGQPELGVFSAALFGGLCAFLLFNFHPAKVFMGDTGSLFLGGTVCGLAFALDIPLIILLVGIIYVAETVSDIIQVVYFKATHGKRIFRMAPLHHHLEMGGWSEVKLFIVFTLITLAACMLAFWGVANRFPG